MVLSNVLIQSVIAKQIIPYFSNFKHLKMSKVLITAKRDRGLPWEIWGRRQGGRECGTMGGGNDTEDSERNGEGRRRLREKPSAHICRLRH